MQRSRNFRLLAGMAAIVLIIALLAACGPAKPAGPIVMRYSTALPTTQHIVAELLPWYAAEIENRTNGDVKLEIYGGAELYRYDESVDAVISGALDMALCSATHWGGRGPIFGWAGYFFIVSSYEQYEKALPRIHKVMEKVFEEQGAKMMYYMFSGSTVILSTTQINTVADFSGLKIRGPAPGHVASIETLGATPAKMAAAEVYDAIAKGAIDGSMTLYSTFYTRKQYEVAKYGVGPIIWDPWYPTMNLALWDSLPGSIQKVFNEVNEEMAVRAYQRGTQGDEEARQGLTQEGVTLKTLTPQEAAQWAAAMQPGYDAWIKECEAAGYGDEAREIVEALTEAGK